MTEVKDASAGASMDLRYVGQEYTLTIPVALERSEIVDDAAGLRASFARAYAEKFGYNLDDAVEIVTVRASSRIPLPRRVKTWDTAAETLDDDLAARQAYSFELDGWETFRVVDRAGLHAGSALQDLPSWLKTRVRRTLMLATPLRSPTPVSSS